MKHFKIDDTHTLRTDSDYSFTQVLEWSGNEISCVYSNNGTFTVPVELEEMDELPSNVKIGQLQEEDIKMFYYKGVLIFPNCEKNIKHLLTLRWIAKNFIAELNEEEDVVSLVFKDAKFIFKLSDHCSLLTAKGDYHKYMDYLYYRLHFTR